MSAWIAWLTAAVGDISPKVKAGLNWGVLASLMLALAGRITPEMLSGLGPWEPLVYMLIPLVAGQVAAWLTSDPFREAGKTALVKQPTAAPNASTSFYGLWVPPKSDDAIGKDMTVAPKTDPEPTAVPPTTP